MFDKYKNNPFVYCAYTRTKADHHMPTISGDDTLLFLPFFSFFTAHQSLRSCTHQTEWINVERSSWIEMKRRVRRKSVCVWARAREPGTVVQIWFILNRIITTAPSFYGGRDRLPNCFKLKKKKQRKKYSAKPLDNRSHSDLNASAKCTTLAIKVMGRRRYGSCIPTQMQNRVAHPLHATNWSTHFKNFSSFVCGVLPRLHRLAICLAVCWSINFYSSLYGTQEPNFHSNKTKLFGSARIENREGIAKHRPN